MRNNDLYCNRRLCPVHPRTAAQAGRPLLHRRRDRQRRRKKSLWSQAKTAPHPIRWRLQKKPFCTALFHTFDGWKSPKNGGLSVKRGEKAVIRCKLWKYKDSPKPEDLPADADPLTQAAAEQGGGDYYMTTAYLFRTLAGREARTEEARRKAL